MNQTKPSCSLTSTAALIVSLIAPIFHYFYQWMQRQHCKSFLSFSLHFLCVYLPSSLCAPVLPLNSQPGFLQYHPGNLWKRRNLIQLCHDRRICGWNTLCFPPKNISAQRRKLLWFDFITATDSIYYKKTVRKLEVKQKIDGFLKDHIVMVSLKKYSIFRL